MFFNTAQKIRKDKLTKTEQTPAEYGVFSALS